MLRRAVLPLFLVAAVAWPCLAQNKPPRAKGLKHPAFVQITDDPSLPRVLLIGDSISLGYTLPLRETLTGKANLHRPATNCGPSTRGVEYLEEWLKTGGSEKWDVIQFNHGLHDIRHFADPENKKPAGATEGHRQVLEEDYEKNLRTIVARLKKTGAKLIWRTTTPVPEGASGRVPGDEVRYNEIAKKIMDENAIAIDDMHAFCLPRLSTIQIPKDVHFTDAGSKALAEHTAKMIIEALPATPARENP
jgi:acyl-CoA thioesterase-1